MELAQLVTDAKKRHLNLALSVGTFENLLPTVHESLTLANCFFEICGDACGIVQIGRARSYLKHGTNSQELTFLFKEIGDRLDIPGRSPELAADFWALHRRCRSFPVIWRSLGFRPSQLDLPA